jgi:hypothetical protein
MNSLNWDYTDTPEDMLAVIEGKLESSGAFNQEKLLVRSFERLSWYPIIELWGVEAIKKLYTPELARRIWPQSLRWRYDFALISKCGTRFFLTGGTALSRAYYHHRYSDDLDFVNDVADIREIALREKVDWQIFQNDINRIIYEMMSGN